MRPGGRRSELPNIMFVQLESFFDPTEVEWLRFSEDPIPNLRKLFCRVFHRIFQGAVRRCGNGKHGV